MLKRYLPVAAALAALAGCGSSIAWSATKVQDTIKDVLTKQAGVQVQSVKCPTDVKIAKGVVTYCTATLAAGDTVRFSATQTDSNGHVHVGPAEMIATEVESRIESSLRKRSIRATATCPQHVPIVVGRTFVCTTADSHGALAKVGVTITTPSSAFTMKLLGS